MSLVLKPNDPANNWRLDIGDTEITSIWIWNIKTYYLVSLVWGLSGYWLLLNFIAILTKASWRLKGFFFFCFVFGRKCHSCVGSSSLLFYCTLLCHQGCSHLDRLEIQEVAQSFITWNCSLWARRLHKAKLSCPTFSVFLSFPFLPSFFWHLPTIYLQGSDCFYSKRFYPGNLNICIYCLCYLLPPV